MKFNQILYCYLFLTLGIFTSQLSHAQKLKAQKTNKINTQNDINAANKADLVRYFDGNLLTMDFVEKLTKNTKRDLYYWSDCSAGVKHAKELGLTLIEPTAQGCLYLTFGVPSSVNGEEWVEYWLLDQQCSGKQSAGCFLGYLIDTRINNESTMLSLQDELQVESSHEFWGTQLFAPNLQQSTMTNLTVDKAISTAELNERQTLKGRNRKQSKPDRKSQKKRTSKQRTAGSQNLNQAIEPNNSQKMLVRVGSVLIEQSINSSSRKETTTTYFDSNGNQSGDPISMTALATSTADDGSTSSDDGCDTTAEDAGDTVGDVVNSFIKGGMIGIGAATGGVAGAISGAIGGAAAGATLAPTSPITAPAGGISGAVFVGISGTLAGGTLGNTIGGVAGAIGGAVSDAITTVVVKAGCDSGIFNGDDNKGNDKEVEEL